MSRRRFALLVASGPVAIALAYFFLDRALATWLHQNLRDFGRISTYVWASGHKLPVRIFLVMAAPAEFTGPAAAILFALIALRRGFGRPAGKRLRAVLAISLATLAALAIKEELKFAFGRPWPESWLGNNPSWIRDGVFGFFPFHGGYAFESFPSGHMTAIAAPAAALWYIYPRCRVLCAIAAASVGMGLVAGNYHFLSDVIAGAYLGAGVGIGVAAFMLDFYRPPATAAGPTGSDHEEQGDHRVRTEALDVATLPGPARSRVRSRFGIVPVRTGCVNRPQGLQG